MGHEVDREQLCRQSISIDDSAVVLDFLKGCGPPVLFGVSLGKLEGPADTVQPPRNQRVPGRCLSGAEGDIRVALLKVEQLFGSEVVETHFGLLCTVVGDRRADDEGQEDVRRDASLSTPYAAVSTCSALQSSALPWGVKE